MAKYKRIKGGERNAKSGTAFTKVELLEIGELYIAINGKGIHENNPQIHQLANRLERTIRSVENQLLGFRSFVTNKTGRSNYNTLIPSVWNQLKSKKNKLSKSIGKNVLKREEFNEFKFRISSQLKNVLGKNLITDDFVAVFELVKNSFDAHATSVKIVFDKNKITVWDNGKGMNRRDIIDKWLFIAYSAKNEGVEDVEFEKDKNISYRDRINPKKSYAGEKGIGRFGCDRLGSKLNMTTRKINDSTYWNLRFDWDEYEINALNEFSDIDIDYKESNTTVYKGFTNGLVLEISNLRNVWPRKKIVDLKRSLGKLINPFSIKNKFNIEIVSLAELGKDAELRKEDDFNESKIVNGSVKNFIFETLNIATTQIKVAITKDEKEIETELIDRGNLIYRISEPNTFRYLPAESSIVLFYLNQRAKNNFTRLMGMTAADFGSIFLFNNGFRVLPFGEPNNDPFNVNQRKAQGYARFLGTRELIGQVAISVNTEQFKETSSRDGGLEDSLGVKELGRLFMDTLKKLESFVSPILWKIKKRTGDEEETLDLTAKNQILDFVGKISGKKNINLIDYSSNLIKYINENIEEENIPLFDKLRSIAINAGDEKSLLIIEKSEKKFQKEVNRRKIAEENAAKAENVAAEEKRKRREAEEAKNEVDSQNLFLKSIRSNEFDEVVSFLHHIGLGSKNIDNQLKLFVKRLRKGKKIDADELLKTLDYALFENRKILTISKFASKANFKLFTSVVELDIIEYFSEYINNILNLVSSQSPKVTIFKNVEDKFVIHVKPIELNIIIDNLISNSRRARATKLDIEFRIDNNALEVKFIDDGLGVDAKNKDILFELGFTTTSGSGIGLYHLKNIMTEMGGEIYYNDQNDLRTEFVLIIKK